MIRRLPFLMPSEGLFNDAQRAVDDYVSDLQARIAHGEVRVPRHRRTSFAAFLGGSWRPVQSIRHPPAPNSPTLQVVFIHSLRSDGQACAELHHVCRPPAGPAGPDRQRPRSARPRTRFVRLSLYHASSFRCLTYDLLTHRCTELTAPEGRNTIPAPPLVLDGVVFSPDCGWQVALNATGMRFPIFQRKALNFASGVIIVRSVSPVQLGGAARGGARRGEARRDGVWAARGGAGRGGLYAHCHHPLLCLLFARPAWPRLS